jgi:hypothetical protein
VERGYFPLVAFERAGAGPPLVLVHGRLNDHRYWQPVISDFVEQFAVYGIDRRGRRGSGPQGSDYLIEREYEDIAAVVESLSEPVPPARPTLPAIGAYAGHLNAVGWKPPKAAKPANQLTATREAVLAALKASAAGEIPSQGPRGGVRWSARWFVRRVAWHVMAHAWEIERRAATWSPQ